MPFINGHHGFRVYTNYHVDVTIEIRTRGIAGVLTGRIFLADDSAEKVLRVALSRELPDIGATVTCSYPDEETQA